MNEDLRSKVRAGIAFLDERYPDWLSRVGNLDTLDMHDLSHCVLGRVTGLGYDKARDALEMSLDMSLELGFAGKNGAEEHELTDIWIDEIRKRIHKGGEEPTYPWVWKGYPARIVEENLRGVIGNRVLILYLAEDVEISSIVLRDALKENKSIKLGIGTNFNYEGLPRMVVAIPGRQFIIIDIGTGGWDGKAVPFTNAKIDTFAPEDFGLDPAFVEIDDD